MSHLANLITSNRILGALPADDLDFMHPHLEPVSLRHGDALVLPDRQIEFVYSSRRGLPPRPNPLPTRPWRSEWLAARAWLVSLSCSEATALPTGSSSRVQATPCALRLRTSSASRWLGDRCRTAFCSMYRLSWFRSARPLRQTHASAPASVSLAGY